MDQGQPRLKGMYPLAKDTCLADVRERCPSAPLDHGVHELDFERLDVFFFYDWQLGLFADFGDASGNLLHDP